VAGAGSIIIVGVEPKKGHFSRKTYFSYCNRNMPPDTHLKIKRPKIRIRDATRGTPYEAKIIRVYALKV
jgi:hypothetical protein